MEQIIKNNQEQDMTWKEILSQLAVGAIMGIGLLFMVIFGNWLCSLAEY